MRCNDINRSGEMEVFARVVDEGGFSSAARSLRMTPSAVSKLVARLEGRLGVRLLVRSTRKLQLTPEGATFHEKCRRILEDMASAEQAAAAGASPRGRLRINSNVHFARACLLPLLPEFLALYPDIQADVAVTDTVIDLMEERADVAIRVGPLRESRLLARKLGESRHVVVAAPSYLARRGTPQRPQDLYDHNRLGFCFTRLVNAWPFLDGAGGTLSIPPVGNALVSDGESMLALILAGGGIARLSGHHVRPQIEAGQLVPLLEAFNPGDPAEVHAVFVGRGGDAHAPIPARVRVFIDFLAERISIS